MSSIIEKSIKYGVLEVESNYNIKFTTRRIFNRYILSKVLVLKLFEPHKTPDSCLVTC